MNFEELLGRSDCMNKEIVLYWESKSELNFNSKEQNYLDELIKKLSVSPAIHNSFFDIGIICCQKN